MASAGRELDMTTDLGFRTDVLNALAPIIREYGYRVAESDDGYVRLDSDNASIQVVYDRRRSFEVAVTFSEQENGNLLRRIPFNLGEVYREFEVPESSKRCYFQSADVANVRAFLADTCGLLLDHCRPILAGDRDAFEAVNERRSREAESYTRQVQMAAVRKQADDAWRNKRFEEFVNLLGTFRDALSDAEKKKLDYALKKSATRSN